MFWLGYEINHLKQKDKCDISGKYVEKLIGFISANTDENMLRHSPPATTRNSAAIIEPAVLSNDSGLLRDQWELPREGANKQVISSQADSLIKISRIWADFFPAN
ncbi:hypothetical protein QL288_03025, partial [Citrobacter youngae]|nr:hypothetical protein [Citrobacter youngae]